MPPSRKFIAITADYAGVKATSETFLPCKNEYNEFDLFGEVLKIEAPLNRSKSSLFISVWLFDQKGSEYELARFEIPLNELSIIGKGILISRQKVHYALSRLFPGRIGT